MLGFFATTNETKRLESKQGDLPRCVIKKLAQAKQVRQGFVRYDEGYRCVSWLKWGDTEYMSESLCSEEKAPEPRAAGGAGKRRCACLPAPLSAVVRRL